MHRPYILSNAHAIVQCLHRIHLLQVSLGLIYSQHRQDASLGAPTTWEMEIKQPGDGHSLARSNVQLLVIANS